MLRHRGPLTSHIIGCRIGGMLGILWILINALLFITLVDPSSDVTTLECVWWLGGATVVWAIGWWIVVRWMRP